MSKYTAEQMRDWLQRVFEMSIKYDAGNGIHHKNMADAIDALLRERESAKAAVTDEMVDIALTTMYGEQFADISGKAEEIFRQHMRAALEAVAPMLASARVPNAMKVPMLGPEQDVDDGFIYAQGKADGWNACLNVMLAAAPKPETEE